MSNEFSIWRDEDINQRDATRGVMLLKADCAAVICLICPHSDRLELASRLHPRSVRQPEDEPCRASERSLPALSRLGALLVRLFIRREMRFCIHFYVTGSVRAKLLTFPDATLQRILKLHRCLCTAIAFICALCIDMNIEIRFYWHESGALGSASARLCAFLKCKLKPSV